MRLCARGLCDRKGELVDFRHPLTRDVAYVELHPDGPRPDAPRARRAPRRDVARTRPLGGHRRAAPRARRELRPRRRLLLRGRRRGAGEPPDAARHPLLPARAVATSGPRIGGAWPGTRRSRALTACSGGGASASGTSRRSGASCATSARPRVVCLGLAAQRALRLRRGTPRARLGVARAARPRSRTPRTFPRYEVEAEALVSDFLRELGDVQGALAACDRALSAFDVSGGRASRRGCAARSCARAASCCAASGACARPSTRTSTPSPSSASAGRAAWRRACKNALAYAMFVQGRYEDAVALALESIQIDLSIGGRFQIAKTLTNIGHAYFRLGDVPRALAYLKRAREAHDRYGDQDGWADTLLVSALGDDRARRPRGRRDPPARRRRAQRRDPERLRQDARERRAGRCSRARGAQPQAGHRVTPWPRGTRPRRWPSSRSTSTRWPSRQRRASTSARCTRRRSSPRPRSAPSRTCRAASTGSRSASLCADALKRAGLAAGAERPSARGRLRAGAAQQRARRRMRKLFTSARMNAALFETTPVPSVAVATRGPRLRPNCGQPRSHLRPHDDDHHGESTASAASR